MINGPSVDGASFAADRQGEILPPPLPTDGGAKTPGEPQCR
jgi:hypothetical protein